MSDFRDLHFRDKKKNLGFAKVLFIYERISKNKFSNSSLTAGSLSMFSTGMSRAVFGLSNMRVVVIDGISFVFFNSSILTIL